MAKPKPNALTKAATAEASSKRTYLEQSDVPAASLDDALGVPSAILEHYAGKPASPLYVAKALNVDPKGSQLKVLSGAAIAFGLIEGGAQAATISVTDLARRILRPKEENADVLGKRDAVLKPRIFGDFLRSYDGHPFPRQDIALNVLEDMGVPRDKAAEVPERIDASARSVGFIEEIKGKQYVSLQGAATVTAPEEPDSDTSSNDTEHQNGATEEVVKTPPAVRSVMPLPPPATKGSTLATAIADDQRRRRVFITHRKNRDLVSISRSKPTALRAVSFQQVLPWPPGKSGARTFACRVGTNADAWSSAAQARCRE